MNPQKIELICSYHLGQEVMMIDQASKIYGSSRALCVICIQNISQKQMEETNANHQSKFDWIGMEQFQLRVAQYEKEKEIEITEIFEEEKKRLKDIKKLLTTLRDETIQDLNKMILIIEDNLDSLNSKISKEIIDLKEFCNIMSYTKLIDVAETLADKKQQDSIIPQIKKKQEELILQLTNSSQSLLDNFLKKLNSIFICHKNKLTQSKQISYIDIFQMKHLLCCQFGKMIYLIKGDSGAYEVNLEINGNYAVACSDTKGERLLIKQGKKKWFYFYNN